MSFRNSITIVASPRPRVGKTLLARLLTDFHLHEGRSVAAFDLNIGEGALAQFLPGRVSPSEIDDLKGQMALFDRLISDDGISKTVDLGSASFEHFFTLMSQFGFAEEACSHGIALVVMYLMTPDGISVEAYRNLRARFPEAALTPVHNEIFGAAQYWCADRERNGRSAAPAACIERAQIRREATFLIRRSRACRRSRCRY
jgi:hypothetical protein